MIHSFKTTLTAFVLSTLMIGAFAHAESSNEPTREPQATSSSYSDSGDFVNLRFAALGLLIGYVNLDLEFKVSDQWSVGPTVSFWRYKGESSLFTNNEYTGQRRAFGVRSTWSKNGAYRTGFYISPMLQIVDAKITGTGATSLSAVEAKGNGPVVSGVFGYHWFGANWNVSAGAGFIAGGPENIEVREGTTTENVRSSRTAGITLDFMVGYVF